MKYNLDARQFRTESTKCSHTCWIILWCKCEKPFTLALANDQNMFHNDQAFVWEHCCRITYSTCYRSIQFFVFFRLYEHFLSATIALFSFISLSRKQYSLRLFLHNFAFVSVPFCLRFFQHICPFSLQRYNHLVSSTVFIAFFYRVLSCPRHTTRFVSIVYLYLVISISFILFVHNL